MGEESNITPFKITEHTKGIKLSILFWLAVLFLVAIDQLSKIFVWKYFCLNAVSDSVLGLNCYKNYFFAFSIPLAGVAIWAIYIAILIFGFSLYFKKETWEKYEILSVLFVISGVLSNAGERMLNGSVKDFIYLFSGIFNLADFYILLGVVIVIIGTLKNKKPSPPEDSV